MRQVGAGGLGDMMIVEYSEQVAENSVFEVRDVSARTSGSGRM